MNKVIIDTNVLVSFVTDRNLLQQKKATRLFEETASLKTSVLCHPNVISEFVYLMDTVYGVQKEELHRIINDLVELPGLNIIQDLDLDMILDYWPIHVADYGDGILASLCKKTRNSAIGTFDHKFQKELIALGLSVYKNWL